MGEDYDESVTDAQFHLLIVMKENDKERRRNEKKFEMATAGHMKEEMEGRRVMNVLGNPVACNRGNKRKCIIVSEGEKLSDCS